MRFRCFALVVGLALFGASCTDDSPDAAAPKVTPTTIPAPTQPSTTVIPVLQGPTVELTGNSVGGITLGTDAETAIAAMTKLFGPPVADSGWGPQEAPCDNMGTRSRSVSWNSFLAFLATGPTELVKKPGDHLSAYLLVGGGTEDIGGPAGERFVVSDGKPILGRTLAEVQKWAPKAEKFNSEIEGPAWVENARDTGMSGSLSTAAGDSVERTSTARAGLFCID